MVEILCLLFAVLLGGKTSSRKGNSRQGWHGGASWNASLSREVLLWGICSGAGGIWWGHLSTSRSEGLEQEQRGWKTPRESAKQISPLSVGGYVVLKQTLVSGGFCKVQNVACQGSGNKIISQRCKRARRGCAAGFYQTILSSIFYCRFCF